MTPCAARPRVGRFTLTLADGTLKAVDLDRSSVNAAFDRGLRESVQRATPFPPLPETIRKQSDLLVVTLQLPER
jgi:TonB family protein